MISIIRKYQILICFFVAVVIARFLPSPGVEMSNLGFLNFFIIVIFLCIGLTFDRKKIKNIFSKKITTALLWTLIASAFLSPLIAYLISTEMGFKPDTLIGIVLICASTPTLVAGPIMASQMGGNFEISTAFSAIVKILGIFLIPIVLVTFLGSIAKINQITLILEMIYLIIIPGFAGQGIRMLCENSIKKFYKGINWLVILSNFALAYIAFSCMHNQLCQITLSTVLVLLGPCLIVHLLHILITSQFGKHILRLPRDINISVVITACQKNMAVPLSIWAIVFAKTYPGAILTVVIYYLVQFFFDSCLLSLTGFKNKKLSSSDIA
jgi:bile acid:Na+ symporter, BASS family